MQLIILLIYTPLVYTEFHTFITTYTEVTGIEGIPEFWAVSTLDGQELDYYDSINQTLTPRQKWLEDFVSKDMWKGNNEIRKKEQDNLRNRIDKLINHNGTGGIHTYQRMYGCSWDNETEKTEGFDVYSYDGEILITLDINNKSYNTKLQQTFRAKWVERVQNDFIMFLRHECLYWLKIFLSRAALNRRALPKISLLQKEPNSHVICHVTGFYPNGTTITWTKNGQPLNALQKLGECLPNEDGTFQMSAALYVIPSEWKKEHYVCVVEHKSWTEKILINLTDDTVKSNYPKKTEAVFPFILVYAVVGVVGVGVICLTFLYRRLNSCMPFYNKCPTKT